MKSDKLIDAIGMIDPKLLEKSEQSYKKRKWTRISAWTSAVAALLVVAILVGGLVGNPTLPFEDSTTTASNEENNVNPPPSNDPSSPSSWYPWTYPTGKRGRIAWSTAALRCLKATWPIRLPSWSLPPIR